MIWYYGVEGDNVGCRTLIHEVMHAVGDSIAGPGRITGEGNDHAVIKCINELPAELMGLPDKTWKEQMEACKKFREHAEEKCDIPANWGVEFGGFPWVQMMDACCCPWQTMQPKK